jgi:FkbM family methyltransferase
MRPSPQCLIVRATSDIDVLHRGADSVNGCQRTPEPHDAMILQRERVDRLKRDPAFASLTRSLENYYGDEQREAAIDALYARFLRPGDLAFDVGSHVGDRIGSFRRNGARVVAVEPQPLCAGVIRALYGDDRDVCLVESACGSTAGNVTLHINSANPTVTTASRDFVRAADGAGGWEGQVWDRQVEVPVTTLDALIAAHGTPAFVKIDVEGFEASVLAGLSVPLPALSFEFTTIQRDVALACLERIDALGDYRFDVSLGESLTFAFSDCTSDAVRRHIAELPHEANSGDVYAVRLGRPG